MAGSGRSLTPSMRNLLFVHNNFPAQFKHVGPLLAREGRYAVAALHKRTDLPLSLIHI